MELLKQEKDLLRVRPDGADAADLGLGAEADDAAAAEDSAFTVKREKDPQQQAKEILQERMDLYKIDIDENELNLRRNIILGGVFYFDILDIPVCFQNIFKVMRGIAHQRTSQLACIPLCFSRSRRRSATGLYAGWRHRK
jgi:hypothetical protein